ncbi:hypothetical protein BC940DRAFT_292098 [Gongronella butleri]|nr:hypothetical protein BC940DRAFT_292098 [Gongronella butleri]
MANTTSMAPSSTSNPHVPHATYSRLYYLPLLRRHFRSLTKRHFIRSLGQHLVSSFLVDDDTGAKVTCMQAWQLLADGSVWTRLYLHDDRPAASGDKKWALQHQQSYFAIDDTDPAKMDYKTTVEIRRKHLTTAGSMQWLPRDIFQKVFQRGLKDVLRTDPPDYNTAKQWEPNANVAIGSLAHLFDEQSDLLPHMSMAALDRVESKLQLQGYHAPESRTTENNEDAWYPVPGQPDAYNKIRHELRTSHANSLDGITAAQKESRQTLIDACARDLYCHSRQYIHADERDTSGEASDASLMSTPQYIRVKSAFHASSSAKLLSRDWIPGRLSNLADQPLLTTKGLDQLPAVPLFYRFKRPRTRVQLHHLDDDQLNGSQDNDIDADAGAWHATSIPEFMLNDIYDNSGAASPIQQDIEPEPSSFMNISTQPVAGMHAARQPPEPEAKKKKKRKKVVSGFM